MELILKTNNKNSIAEIIALAKKLNVTIEQRNKLIEDKNAREELKERILNFNATTPSSFGDPAEWQRSEREDRELPFSK
ncbi:MAG TPA: hypothetical protein VGN20_13180 [Mucilaginibacter sp.]|jgi:antitoxin component of MazEF toxin-antitoxin module